MLSPLSRTSKLILSLALGAVKAVTAASLAIAGEDAGTGAVTLECVRQLIDLIVAALMFRSLQTVKLSQQCARPPR